MSATQYILPPGLTIAYDAKRLVRNATGLGSYSRTLVDDIATLLPEEHLLLMAPDKGNEALYESVLRRPNVELFTPKRHSFMWRSFSMVTDLKQCEVDLYHGLSGELPHNLKNEGIKGVVTIHDLIFLRHPQYYALADRLIYTWKFRDALRNAAAVIAISECTRRDILHYGGQEARRVPIHVVYQSCNKTYSEQLSPDMIADTKRRLGLHHPYMVCVGTIEERKNALLAVKAMEGIDPNVHLVLAGRPTPYARKIQQYVARHGLGERVHMIHGLDNDSLRALYQGAEICLYPSRYEGFGLPVTEGLMSGLPVIAATGSCLEEAGGPDCLYVSPDNAQQMAEAMRHLLADPAERRRRALAGLSHIRRFDNAIAAQQVADVYASLTNDKS